MKPEKFDIYTAVTDKFIEMLEKGVCPWNKPWDASHDLPRNWDGRPYRGVNQWMLDMNKYPTNTFLTFNKGKGLGGSVKKGERGNMVVFWAFIDKPKGKAGASADDKKIPLLRYYTVFNESQFEGLPERPKAPERIISPIEACEQIVEGMPKRPNILEDGKGECYYRKSTDEVHMTGRASFSSMEAYYATLFHELAHATGHDSRLNRKGVTEAHVFGGPNYGREELVAEMTSANLCQVTGIGGMQLVENSAAYLASWIKTIKDDTRAIIEASGKAAAAADYIRNVTYDKAPEKDSLSPQIEPAIQEDESLEGPGSNRVKNIKNTAGLTHER